MGLTFDACPYDGVPFQRSDKILTDRVVLRCPACKRHWIEGDTRFFSGPNVFEDLEDRAERLDRETPEARQKAMWESDDDDPRWSALA